MKRFFIHAGIFVSIMAAVATLVFFVVSHYESPQTAFTVAEAKDEEPSYEDILILSDDATIEGIKKDVEETHARDIDEGFIELEQFFAK